MRERSIYLFCTEGGSDKEYHVHLRAKDAGWVVDYANGKRGAVGQSKPKTASPVSFDAANIVFDDLVKSKKKTGYTESESGVRFTNTDNDRSQSAHRQQLPTSLDEECMRRALKDDNMAVQEKANGERRTIEVVNGVARGINKLGEYVNIPENLVEAFSHFRDAMFDGEQVGTHFHAFDLLSVDKVNFKGMKFKDRYFLLQTMLQGTPRPPVVHQHVSILQAYFTTAEKAALIERLAFECREGVVFKQVDEPYDAGRSNAAVKYKFVDSSSCLVLKQNVQRSVQLGLLNAAGAMVSVGNVTIPANHAVPAVGDVVEVQYLYFNPGGAFEQPVYLGKRNDILPEEATLAQITRLKPGAGPADLAAAPDAPAGEQEERVFERARG